MAIRPLIFWGIDGYSNTFVRGFEAFLKEKVSQGLFYWVFEPKHGGLLRELQNTLIDLRQISRERSPTTEPGLVLFCTAFVPEAGSNLDLLDGVSKFLEVTLPGSQSIVLVVLSPSLGAQPHEKLEAFKYFLRLEQLVWEVPYLRTILVHQLPQRLPQDEAAEKSLHELAYRGLLDEDLDNVIRELGDTAIRMHTTVAGRKCCYSTLGAYRLIYYPTECINYLEARFQHELFHEVFFNEVSVLENRSELEAIQLRADQFIEAQAKALAPRILECKPFLMDHLGRQFNSETASEKVKALEKEVGDLTTRAKVQSEYLRPSVKDVVEGEFISFLVGSKTCLARPKLYADALGGRRIFSAMETTAEQPSGIKLFEKLTCIDPFVHSLQELFEPHVREALSELGLPSTAEPEPEDRLVWLSNCSQLAKLKIDNSNPGTISPAKFVFQALQICLEYLNEGAFDVTAATALTRRIISSFSEGVEGLALIIQHNRENRRKAEDEATPLKKEYTFLQRLISGRKRAEYSAREKARRQRIKSLDEEFAIIKQALGAIYTFFLSLMNSVICPNIVRTIFSQLFEEEVNKTRERFYSFIYNLEKFIDARWQENSRITEYTTRTCATVLNKKKLQKIYDHIIAQQQMIDLAEKTLSFVPSHLSDSELENLSYRNCHDLKDHYVAGAKSLLDRMAHHAHELFKPVRTMNILDIIEVEGAEAAHECLKAYIEKTKNFLDFSAGLLPVVGQSKKMNSVLMVRSAEAINKKLASDYSFLFGFDPRFISNDDTDSIDLTSLFFGFPAFLIHSLSEARRLYRDSGGSEAGDLWPEATP